MAKIDTLYKAYKSLRNITKPNLELSKERKELMESNLDLDTFTTTKFLVKIDEEWILRIEEKMEFIEKAISEERQFIRVDGDIVPIEKVKKVSRSSVEYLAKHSNQITHIPDDGSDPVPDELYITEKNADYAVYENRFLYMLLRYLDDFITFRLEKIETLRQTYISNLIVEKSLDNGKRSINYRLSIDEKRLDNPYPIFDKDNENRIKRMKDIQSIVTALLNTNLMIDVSKTPLIKPPITKTNVLKMNNNFKNALALYEYISSYKGAGYSKEEVVTKFTPLTDDNKDEIAEPLVLSNFITYKIGNNLEKELNLEYQNSIRKEKEEENRKFDERIKRLKRKALESEKTMEEYMALLEIRNQQLLKDSEDLALARDEINRLNQEITKLNKEKEELFFKIDKLQLDLEEKLREIAYLKQKYIDDMAKLKAAHAAEIERINEAHEAEIEEISIELENKLTQEKESYENEIRNLTKDHEIEIERLEREKQEIIDTHESKIIELKDKIQEVDQRIIKMENEKLEIRNEYEEKLKSLESSKNNEINSIIKENESKIKSLESKQKDELSLKDEAIDDLTQNRDLFKAELMAIKIKNNEVKPNLDLASRERFIELESEKRAFDRFFDEQWKLTKKKIKSDIKEGNIPPVEKETKEKEEEKAQELNQEGNKEVINE